MHHHVIKAGVDFAALAAIGAVTFNYLPTVLACLASAAALACYSIQVYHLLKKDKNK
jgi:hypothetical protein